MPAEDYKENLRRIKSQLLSSTLQERRDITAAQLIQDLSGRLNWTMFKDLGIDREAWAYTTAKGYDPRMVFCHPDLLMAHPSTGLYYRAMCGLSIKAAKEYVGAVENLERVSSRTKVGNGKAAIMARTYNSFMSDIINNSTNWTLEDGLRTIIATLGISTDGTMRNRVGTIAEGRIRVILVEWLVQNKLITAPRTNTPIIPENLVAEYALKQGIIMRFSSEPDIAFEQDGHLSAIIEIKGGIDPAGALERYGAAKKSFEEAMRTSPRCKTFYLGGVFTEELEKRMDVDRLVEMRFSIIELLQDPEVRSTFLNELFHYTLRLI